MLSIIISLLVGLLLGAVGGFVFAILSLRNGLAEIGVDLDELVDLIEKVREREKEQKDKAE